MPLIVLGYFIGSIPFALVLARYRGLDLRKVGSGNLGAANVLRASGPTAGVMVAILDIAKGAVSVLVADQLSDGPTLPALAGFAAIVGHIYPIWLRFRGGKGVATACGVFAVLTPLAVVPAFAAFIATVWITRYISLGSVIASLVLPPLAYVTGSSAPEITAAVAASILIVFRHRSNLARIASGTERRIGSRVVPAIGPDFEGPEA
jgi:acyl phosphate:glycerol-3-phosphate acyltransferase